MTWENEQLLIRDAVKGNIQAFEALIDRHQQNAYNIALRVMCHREDAYDVTQEAMIKVFKSLKSFKGDSSFSTWLYRIVTNTALDELRKRKKHYHMSLDGSHVDPNLSDIDVSDNSPGPHEVFEQKEEKHFIETCLNALNEDQRSIIVLRDINGFSYEEISDILECNIGTVKSRINRARLQLRDIYKSKMEQCQTFDV